jgi:hypothetical protein
MSVLNNVAELIIQATLPTTGSGTKNIYNVFHYVSRPGTPLPIVTVINQFNSQVEAALAAQLSVDYVYVTTIGRYLDDATVQYSTSAVNGVSGAVALPRLPTDVAIVMPLRCVQRGKNFRGSKHFSGIPTATVTKDEINVGSIAAWNAIAAAILLPINPGGGPALDPCVVSRSLSQTKTNPTLILGSLVNAVLVNKTIGTMRHRKERTVR